VVQVNTAGLSEQASVQLPAPAVNASLLAFAAERNLLLSAVLRRRSCWAPAAVDRCLLPRHGAQQQTRRTPLSIDVSCMVVQRHDGPRRLRDDE